MWWRVIVLVILLILVMSLVLLSVMNPIIIEDDVKVFFFNIVKNNLIIFNKIYLLDSISMLSSSQLFFRNVISGSLISIYVSIVDKVDVSMSVVGSVMLDLTIDMSCCDSQCRPIKRTIITKIMIITNMVDPMTINEYFKIFARQDDWMMISRWLRT